MCISVLALAVLSYGFIDPHLSFSVSPVYFSIQSALVSLVYRHTFITAGIYLVLLSAMYFSYRKIIPEKNESPYTRAPRWIMAVFGMLLFSYPMLSYDIFNYIATAKVTFQYQENPYVIMPIDIPNEPMLSYTRAANKLALYGPTWIALTSFPHLVSMGVPFFSIISFKLFVTLFYVALTYMIFRKTKRWSQVAWFALNPLVLLEVIVNGHNDIVMMTLAIGGLLLWHRNTNIYKSIGIILWVSSVLVKGATIALLPLFFLPSWEWEKKMKLGFFLMFGVFLMSPLREEMYPWYAIWWLAFAAFIPMKKQSWIHGFSYWLSFGLMLRYVPWIATREYGGITPLARIIAASIPVALYIVSQIRPLQFVHHIRRKRK